MTPPKWLVDSKNDRSLVGFFIAFCSISLVLAIWWSVTTMTASRRAQVLQQTIGEQQVQLLQAQKSGIKGTFQPQKPVPVDSGGMASYGAFQKDFERAAFDNHVQVNDFGSGSNGGLQPHQSLYAKAAAVDAYSQLHIVLDVTGSLGRVASMLRQLANSSVTFEISSIDFSRMVGKDNVPTVKAVLNVNILTKAKGAGK